MKKLFFIMFLLAGTTLFATAQDKKSPDKLPKPLMKKLNLTPDQEAKIDVIVKAKAAKIDSLNEEAKKPDGKKAKKSRKGVNDDAIAQIENVLTADQKKIYEDFRVEQREKMKAKKSDGTPAMSNTPPSK